MSNTNIYLCTYTMIYANNREGDISVCAEKTREFLREEGNATLYHVLHAYTDTYLHIRTLKKQKEKKKKKKRNKSGTWWNSTCKFCFSRVVLE